MSNIAKYCDGNFTDTTPDLTVSSGFYIGLGIIGNLIALILLVKQSTFHKWKVFYRLVLTLVCVDFAGIVIFGVIGVIESPYSRLNWIDEGPLCKAESVLIVFISLTNILIVTSIAIERFLALWHPYSYSSIKGHPLVMLSPLVILISTVTLATLSLTIGHFKKIYPCNFCFIDIYSSRFMNYIFAFIYVIIGLILATVSIVMNILVAIALSRGQRGYSRQRESRIYISSDRRDYCGMLFQIVAILGILAVCWMPLMVKMCIFFNWINKCWHLELDTLKKNTNKDTSYIIPLLYHNLKKNNTTSCI